MSEFKNTVAILLMFLGGVIFIMLGVDRFVYFDHLTSVQFFKENWILGLIGTAFMWVGAYLSGQLTNQ